MILNIIDLFINIIVFFFVVMGVFFSISIMAKERFRKLNKKKEVDLINKIQLKFKNGIKSIWGILVMLLWMGLSSLLAIGLRPIIHKLNYPLWEGYSIFASYIIAICLYILFRGKSK